MSALYLDHILIAVRDLEVASRTFAGLLGFTLTPEGVHPGRGTHNRLAVLGTECLELIAIRDASEGVFRPTLSAFLESREGLDMFALGTGDIEGAVSELRRRPVAVDDPLPGEREPAGGMAGYTWRSSAVDAAATPGSETFIIQHDQSIEERYTQPAEATGHSNGVVGVHHLALAVRDADGAASRWRDGLGLAVEAKDETDSGDTLRVRLRLANCYLDLVAPAGPGALTEFLRMHGEAPYELGLEVVDLSQAARHMEKTGVPTGEAEIEEGVAGLVVAPEEAHGVRLLLRQRSRGAD